MQQLREHASDHVRQNHGGLGIPLKELGLRIAWDSGTADCVRRLSAQANELCARAADLNARLLVELASDRGGVVGDGGAEIEMDSAVPVRVDWRQLDAVLLKARQDLLDTAEAGAECMSRLATAFHSAALAPAPALPRHLRPATGQRP